MGLRLVFCHAPSPKWPAGCFALLVPAPFSERSNNFRTEVGQHLRNLTDSLHAMSDTKSLIRQWRLLRFLADARQGYTVKELKQELGVSIETVRRDLKDLAEAGFRVRETVGHLVDTVSPLENCRDTLPSQDSFHMFQMHEQGRLTLPVWVDHVGSAGTRYATGNLAKNELGPPVFDRMPVISP